MPSSSEVSIEEGSSSSDEEISPEKSPEKSPETEEQEKSLAEVMPRFLAANEAVRDDGQAGLFPVNSGRWKVMIYSGASGGSSRPDPFPPSQLAGPRAARRGSQEDTTEEPRKKNPRLSSMLEDLGTNRPWPWVDEPSVTETSLPEKASIEPGEPQKKYHRLKFLFGKREPKPDSLKSRSQKFEKTTESSKTHEKSRASTKIELSLLRQMQKNLAEYNKKLFDKIGVMVGEEAARNENPLEFSEFAAKVHGILWTVGLGLANELGVDERWDEWINNMYLEHRRAINVSLRQRQLLIEIKQQRERALQEERERALQEERERALQEERERALQEERESSMPKERESSLERRARNVASRMQELESSKQQRRESTLRQEQEGDIQQQRESALQQERKSSSQRRARNVASRVKERESSIQQDRESSVQQQRDSALQQEQKGDIQQQRDSASALQQEQEGDIQQQRESALQQEQEDDIQQQRESASALQQERKCSSQRRTRNVASRQQELESSWQGRLRNIASRVKELKSIQQQRGRGSSLQQERALHQQQQDDESENAESASSRGREKRKSQDEKHRKSRKKR